MPKDPDQPRLIDRPDALEAALERLAACPVLAVDTEFHWERSYYPRLAVVQVGGRLPGTDRIGACAIDPLALDVGPVLDLLRDPSRLKVLHAGRIDLEIFARLLGEPLEPVFDTQKAAALLGFGHQAGYAALVEAVLGERISKNHQYSNWTRRPLTPAQVRYALLDVVHLLDVYEALLVLLERTGRTAWAEEEMRSLTDPAAYREPTDAEAYERIKAWRRLDRPALGALRELAAWRERTARARDLRPGFVAKDPVLVGLARQRPRSLGDLREARGLHRGEVEKSGQEILDAIRRGEQATELPDGREPRKRRVDVKTAVDLLRACLSERSEEAAVAAEVVATTADLERLAKAHARGEELTDHAVLEGWRGELVGRDLLRILAGDLTLGVDARTGALRLIEEGG